MNREPKKQADPRPEQSHRGTEPERDIINRDGERGDERAPAPRPAPKPAGRASEHPDVRR